MIENYAKAALEAKEQLIKSKGGEVIQSILTQKDDGNFEYTITAKLPSVPSYGFAKVSLKD